MRCSIASCVVLGTLALGLPGSVFATQTIIFSDNFDSGLSSQWVDLSTALPWGGNPVGTSAFTTAGGYVTLTENAKNNTGYGAGKLSMFQALDFQFPEPIDRSGGQATITVEFRAKWDTGTLSNEGSRLGLHFVHSYLEGGLDVNTPSKVTDASEEWWAKPAYNMRIRTVQQDSLLMYGGGPTAEGEFEYDAGNGYWLPGFSSAPGGASPQNFVPGVEGAGVGNYSQTEWKDYKYVLKPDRQELWYDGILVGTQMLGDITDPAQTFDNNGYQKQFDVIEGVRLFIRGQAGRAQAFVDDFVIMVDQPATILDDLFWDPDAGTPGAQGGTGTWSAAGNTFWNGVTNVNFSNDPTERVIFGTSSGTVTLQTDVTAQELVIESNTYTFSAPAARQFNTDLTIAEGATLIKAGAGVLTIDGQLNHEGRLEFDALPGGGMIITGDAVFGDSSTLTVALIDSSEAGVTHDQLAVTGSATLGGTLEVTALPGFAALPGDRFEVLTYGSSTGSFDTFVGIGPGVGGYAGLWFEVEQSAGAVELVAKALLGDANLDGTVDDMDLAIIQANLGDPTKTSWLDGNFSGSSVSLYDAYLLFTNYGSSISPPTVSAIPEPTSPALLGLGSMLLGARRKR